MSVLILGEVHIAPSRLSEFKIYLRELLPRLKKPMMVSRKSSSMKIKWVYADSCGLKTAFLGNGGRNAATIFSLRYSSSR